jgi:hypothetical protein
MADWIDDLAQKAKEKYAGQRQQDEKFNREQKLKETLSKDFWNKVLTALQTSITEFNQKFGSSVITMNSPGTGTANITAQFTAAANDKRTATAGFQPDKHRIFVAEGRPSKSVEYYMDLVDDSHVVAKLKDESLTPDDLARKIIVSIAGG